MLHYCLKCGRIVLCGGVYGEAICDCCKSIVYPVPSKYWLDGFEDLMSKEAKEALREELVKTSPEFDQYLFDHREEILANRQDDLNAKLAVGRAIIEGKKVSRQEILAGRLNSSSNSVSVTCPYCSSTNTKKITATSKAVNTALFGIFGTKRHKQWHCNKCGSDF